MGRMQPESDTCDQWTDLLSEYVDAALWGGVDAEEFAGLAEHLRDCPRCASLLAAALELIRWREAEEPFNAHVLPPPDRWPGSACQS